MVEEIAGLLLTVLRLSSPVLSGNMQAHISERVINDRTREIIIDAPFYDMKEWKKTGNIIHTGAIVDGRTAYAEWVNRLGAFATGNKSQGWVDRAIEDVMVLMEGKGVMINDKL